MSISSFEALSVRFELSSEEEMANVSAPGAGRKKVRTHCFLKLCVCVCLSLHLLGWAHSFWRFLGPQMRLHFFPIRTETYWEGLCVPNQT